MQRQTVENIFRELYPFKLDQSYAQIEKPIIFVACENEEKGDSTHTKQAPKIIPQADTALIPNAEHQWLIQKPDVFNHFLENWLNNS